MGLAVEAWAEKPQTRPTTRRVRGSGSGASSVPLGFNVFSYFLKESERGKYQELGENPQRCKVSWSVGDGLAIFFCLFFDCASLPCLPTTISSTPFPLQRGLPTGQRWCSGSDPVCPEYLPDRPEPRGGGLKAAPSGQGGGKEPRAREAWRPPPRAPGRARTGGWGVPPPRPLRPPSQVC